MHWFKDCPKNNVSSNQVKARSSANRTPMGKNKWPQRGTEEKEHTGSYGPAAPSNLVETQTSTKKLETDDDADHDSEDDRDSCLPSQQDLTSDKEDNHEDAECLIAEMNQDLDQYRHKVPTYAEALEVRGVSDTNIGLTYKFKDYSTKTKHSASVDIPTRRCRYISSSNPSPALQDERPRPRLQ